MVRVLIVDDSALVCRILSKGLAADPEIEVVGTAANPYEARDLIVEKKPDVLTLDVEMPRMNGLEFLKKLMPQYPLPVVMVSALTSSSSAITLDALSAGAVDFVTKPTEDVANSLYGMMSELRSKVKTAAGIDVGRWHHTLGRRKFQKLNEFSLSEAARRVVIAIGASTGGTEAIREVIAALPANSPGIVIVQHMPAGFTTMYAQRLNNECQIEVKEAAPGDIVRPGRALLAPGDFHMKLSRSGDTFRVLCRKDEKICGHRPSVEVLFNSVAKYAGKNAIGILLTGMGKDGAHGLLEMRKAGARTIAQDESTSVVYGMPKEAFICGGAETVEPLHKIPVLVEEYLKTEFGCQN